MSYELSYFNLGGGVVQNAPINAMAPGELLRGVNIEPVYMGGYARMLGYAKWDDNEIEGEGNILGVHYYNGKVYAFRVVTGGASVTMWESAGSGWTAKKTGLTVGGTYRCINANLDGTLKMYIASGVDKAACWDGSTWTDITTGMSPDTPNHIIAHKQHLFLSFDESVQFSSLGDPTTWSVVTGAGELRADTPVTGFMQMPGGELGVFSRNSTLILSGSSSADFVVDNLSEYGNKIGAIENSLQQLGSRLRYLDDRGVIDLFTTQRFGNFTDSTLSNAIDEIIQEKKGQVTGSCIVRDKAQYRLFFGDGTGLIFSYRGDEQIGITTMSWPDIVECATSVEDSNGDELILFGSDDGYVRQMESGNSFDGAAIVAYMNTAYHNYGYLTRVKRFRRVYIDMRGNQNPSLDVQADCVFATDFEKSNSYEDVYVTGMGSLLGYDNLGTFILSSGTSLVEGNAEVNGHGDYMSLRFVSSTTDEPPWEIAGISTQFSLRRLRRGRVI